MRKIRLMFFILNKDRIYLDIYQLKKMIFNLIYEIRVLEISK